MRYFLVFCEGLNDNKDKLSCEMRIVTSGFPNRESVINNFLKDVTLEDGCNKNNVHLTGIYEFKNKGDYDSFRMEE